MEKSGGSSAMQMVRERIRGAWDVDDADIDRSGGSLDKLVDLIVAKTGRPRAEIRKDLRRIFAG